MNTTHKEIDHKKAAALARTMPKWNEFFIDEFKKDPKFVTESVQGELDLYAQTGDISYLLSTLRDVVSAKGWVWLSKETGLSRPTLYEALNGRSKPRFETITKILGALGFRMLFVAVDNTAKKSEEKPTRNIKTSVKRKATTHKSKNNETAYA